MTRRPRNLACAGGPRDLSTDGRRADSADRVVPLLQEQGVFRADSEGPTLRYRLGLGLVKAEGAIACPTLKQARAHEWTEADRPLVRDRVDTRFVGTPAKVAGQLERLQEATGADELLITTMTHEHTHRVRSYELPAGEGARR
ncbi:hypothetical protein [Streptomyces sp. NPDC003635]